MAWRNKVRQVANAVRFCYSMEHPSGAALSAFVDQEYWMLKMFNPQMRFPNRHPNEGQDIDPYLLFHTDQGDHKVDVKGLSDVEILAKFKEMVESLPPLNYIDDDLPPPIIDGIEQQSYRLWGGSI
mmetsp:Transcript_5529/g.21815  ORF Transcript_5529/g.21815 Transcript_5529/m.21815 type:complete len:126 (-) Transcript_5529:50-427(-)